ncbi:response regulator [Cupriavidus numazuensis]|uniref:histidine kinase n=1 Tax=Cupriavidus numazuensis TaxID=221992 RepID=A0ABM8TGT4_9BURK|nr:response regulator [Cupriavidus numazuensis]CAG2144680.1 Sensor histidine kinase RcsC [Cupriavidus numazuensis]
MRRPSIFPVNSSDKSLSVLVVDDYEPMQKAIRNILIELGVGKVHLASSGAEAMRHLKEMPISAVISDWNMPGMTGLELLEWVRCEQRFASLPFMLLTAEATRENIRAAISAGISEYLLKPFTLHAFAEKFQAMVGLAERPPLSPDISRAPTRVVAPDTSIDARITDATVLVVDDVPSNIKVIVGVLEEDGHTIKVALSGKKALEIAVAAAPDIILLDIMMPEMDGFEVCRRLKANPATASIPVIFLSAKDESDDIVCGLEMGAVDYVTKPVEPAVLKARLRAHLRSALIMTDLKEQNCVVHDSARLREDVERITRHDLKNPIGAILQTSQLLLADERSPELRESLQLMESAARDALKMVNLSLDMYRMERGEYRPKLTAVRLNDVLARIAAEVGAQFTGAQHKYVLPDVELIATAEYLLCYSLFGNLIKNAAEAAPAASTIVMSGETVPGRCIVRIVNRGGVPAAIREQFFEKYITHGKVSGTGLGTYSARLMAEVQGGGIELSGDDTSTCLTVSLRAA